MSLYLLSTFSRIACDWPTWFGGFSCFLCAAIFTDLYLLFPTGFDSRREAIIFFVTLGSLSSTTGPVESPAAKGSPHCGLSGLGECNSR